MEKSQKISSVINSLTGLFANKDNLVGFADWDVFIGCIMTLQNVQNMLIAEEQVALAKIKSESEVEQNGEL